MDYKLHRHIIRLDDPIAHHRPPELKSTFNYLSNAILRSKIGVAPLNRPALHLQPIGYFLKILVPLTFSETRTKPVKVN